MTPEWFTAALAAPTKSRFVESAGANVHYRIWGAEHTGPGVLLVHGNTANTHWWDHIAPALATDRRVVAIDLTGFGDSGPPRDILVRPVGRRHSVRARRTPPAWLDNRGAQYGRQARLPCRDDVTPKLGGLVAAGLQYRAQPDPDRVGCWCQPRRHRPAIYPEPRGRRARLSVVPTRRQPIEVPAYVTEHIARNSVRPSPEGWSWKFDYACLPFHPRSACAVGADGLPGRGGPGWAPLGDRRPMPRNTAARFRPRGCRPTLPNAGHHAMLDDPQAVIELLQQLISNWI